MKVWTDGSCLGNPGPGGYGVVFEDETILSGSLGGTTNNRAELFACIQAIINSSGPLEIYTDSKYVVDGVYRNNLSANKDLWDVLFRQIEGRDITFHWIPAHNGIPENEAAHDWAITAAKNYRDE